MKPEDAARRILRAASRRETDLVMGPFSAKFAIFLRFNKKSLTHIKI